MSPQTHWGYSEQQVEEQKKKWHVDPEACPGSQATWITHRQGQVARQVKGPVLGMECH